MEKVNKNKPIKFTAYIVPDELDLYKCGKGCQIRYSGKRCLLSSGDLKENEDGTLNCSLPCLILSNIYKER